MRHDNIIIGSLLILSTTCSSFVHHSPTCSILRKRDESSLLQEQNDNDSPSFSSTRLSRRQWLELMIAAVGLGVPFVATRETKATDYGLFGVLPVGPYKTKRSYFEEIVPGKIWTADQIFGILNVQVPLRMTVVRVGEGLLVYNPVAATPEVVSWLRGLEKDTGCVVRDIVVGSVAVEHKVYAGVLAQKMKAARVWLTEGQYSFPVNLPNEFLGFPKGRTRVLEPDGSSAPKEWEGELEYLTLGPLISRDGAFAETVMFHKSTSTLLCTDTVLEVTEEVPAIYNLDPKPLLFHARDTVSELVEDTPEVRKRGWRRVVLFGLFFTPSAIIIKDANVAFAQRRPDINSDFIGIYPWDWVGDDIASFKALQGGLLVAPILQKLILNRNPIEVLDFADNVAQWNFTRIVPSHLKNNLAYDNVAYRRAFDFLTHAGVKPGYPNPLEADFKTLDDANVNLIQSGAISKIPPFPGGSVSREDILALEAYGCRAGVCTPRSKP